MLCSIRLESRSAGNTRYERIFSPTALDIWDTPVTVMWVKPRIRKHRPFLRNLIQDTAAVTSKGEQSSLKVNLILGFGRSFAKQEELSIFLMLLEFHNVESRIHSTRMSHEPLITRTWPRKQPSRRANTKTKIEMNLIRQEIAQLQKKSVLNTQDYNGNRCSRMPRVPARSFHRREVGQKHQQGAVVNSFQKLNRSFFVNSVFPNRQAMFSHRISVLSALEAWEKMLRNNIQRFRLGKRNLSVPISELTASPPLSSSFPPYTGRDFFNFEVLHRSKRSSARVGRISTPHGSFLTPAFVAVATNAALKSVCHRSLEEALPLVFCNTYHLMLHPGPEIVGKAGGLHRFMKRKGPIITDSGGFQVFSLAHGSVAEELNMREKRGSDKTPLLMNVSEKGATFRSYRDGTALTLTPESSVQAQKSFGADIIIPLDELPPYHIDRDNLRESVDRSHRWEARSLRTHLDDIRSQAMYCVVHGGVDKDLRQHSIDYLTSLPFDGIAIGGSLGKTRDELVDLLTFVMPKLPTQKPNHLLGIADARSIARIAPLGVDTFDSCFPTRLGRHGTLLTERYGAVQIRQSKWKDIIEPPNLDDESSDELSEHSMAYLHHLYKQNEPMSSSLLTAFNLLFMSKFMTRIREAILNDEI